MTAMWVGSLNGPGADARYILRGEFTPEPECRGKSDADFIGTERKEAMSRSAGEGAFHPLSKLGVEHRSVLVSLDDQSTVRGQNRR
ncbi:MAG: hypothetical protein WBL63_01230 [Candidatus Acidiferrum sp.]